MTDFAATDRCDKSPGAPLPWLRLALASFAAQSDDAEEADSSPIDARAAVDIDDVRAAKNGDDGAFERIVRRYQQEIARRLRRFSRDPDVIEELTQETFVQAYTSLARFRGGAPLLHWLHRIAVRSGYRYWTENHGRLRSIAGEVPDVAESVRREDQRGDRLVEVLEALSPRDRLVLTLIYLEGHSVVQTAALTGWSRTMVKVQAFRARSRLRKLMKQHEAGGDL